MIDDAIDQRVGENIRRLRAARGFSQAELARYLGEPYRQQTVLKVEKGTRPLKLSEAVKIAEVLAVEVKDLYRSDSVGQQQVAQIAGMLPVVQELYDGARRAIGQLEAWRFDMRDMLDSHQVDDFPPKLEEAVRSWGRDDLVEACVEEARHSAALSPLTEYTRGNSRG
jgi:transcriptional regulator with XRE-family HTH domain